MSKGINFALFVKTGEDATSGDPIFSKLGGQRGGTLNRSRDTIDETSKDSEGWREKDYGFGEWSIEGDGLLVEDETAYMKLEDAFMNEEKILAYWMTGAGHKYQGNVVITDFPMEGPYDAEATYSITCEGDGKPTKVLATQA